MAWLNTAAAAAQRQSAPDPRNFGNGNRIPAQGYCDQPRIVVTSDGTWVCVLTTGPGDEGDAGQHVAASFSEDKGKTWSPLVAVEPPDKDRKSAYALALITPQDRVYAFYNYNGDAIRAKPDGSPIRDDMQGWCCYRYSDDQGKTWSQRYRVPMRLTAADRNNEWQGKLQMFWIIGTPAVFDGTAMFGFTKLGKYILENGEGWFFRSDNILREPDPEKIEWQLLPDGDHGVRAPEFGSVQEEFDVVHLEKDDWFCVNRTTLGHAACSYSRDGGHTWTRPDALRYSPGGRIVKQPRACAKIWQARNGRYLLWFHNNGTTTYNNGPNAGSRNIAWLSAGRLKDGFVFWSQPEIVAYVDGGLQGCSYPDFIEDSGRYYICATQKTEARVMDVEPGLLAGLWDQDTRGEIATNGLALNLTGENCAANAKARAPRLAPLCGDIQRRKPDDEGAGGLTIEVAARFADLAPGQVLLDSRDGAGRGYALRTIEGGAVRFEMADGWQAASWDSDAGLLQTNTTHHIVVAVDGRVKVICFVLDGVLNDGGARRQFGFGRFNPTFKDVSGARDLRIAPALHGELGCLRLYNRTLRTSEAVGNFRSLPR
ncbi:MAG TPA: hypothetical protein P5205_02075 [Candidatus Paceibacterota bacterium]|nr:hypothetical protein [Candidatus Paceibacterota bacterium]